MKIPRLKEWEAMIATCGDDQKLRRRWLDRHYGVIRAAGLGDHLAGGPEPCAECGATATRIDWKETDFLCEDCYQSGGLGS